MADLIDIELGDQRIRVPAWATEATLEAVMKYNEITARALNKLVGVGTDGKKTFRVQEHYFKQIVEELQKSKKKQEELVNQNTKIIKAEKTKSSTTTARVKTQNSDKSSTDFDKKISELSKSYSTSVSLVEGSLLYLSKSLIDLNLVLRDVSKTFKSMTQNAGATGSSAAGGGGSNNNSTSSGNRNRQRSTIRNPEEIFNVRNRYELGFNSRMQRFVEDLVDRQREGVELAADNQVYIQNLKKLQKQILDKKQSLGLSDEDRKTLSKTVSDIIGGTKTVSKELAETLDNIAGNYYKYDTILVTVMDRIKEHYFDIDDSLNDIQKLNKNNLKTFNSIVDTQQKFKNAVLGNIADLGKSSLTGSFNMEKLNESFSKLLTIIPLAGGALSVLAGIAGSVFIEYVNSLKQLNGVSAGFGMELTDLSGVAAQAKMSFSDFAKLISENGEAIKSLGNSTQEGMLAFAALSSQLMDTSKKFNYYGLAPAEYNQMLVEEIELRRRSGMESSEITNSLNNSFNDMIYNSTQLAAITGQDVRKMRANRANLLSDPVVAAARAELVENNKLASDNLDIMFESLTKGQTELGKELASAFAVAAQQNADFMTYLSPAARTAITMSPSGGEDVRELYQLFKNNLRTDQNFSANFQAQISEMSDAIVDSQQNLVGIGALKDLPVSQAISQLFGLGQALQGGETDPAAIQAAMEANKEAMLNSPASALVTEFETLATTIKDSAINESMAALGIDSNNAAEGIKNLVTSLTESIKANGLTGTVTDAAMSPSIIGSVIVGGLVTSLGGTLFRMLSGKALGSLANFTFGAAGSGAAGVNAARGMMSFAGAGAGGAAAGAGAGGAAAGASGAGGAAAGAAQTGSKFASFLKWLPIVGDVAQGVSEGLETGSVGRGLFGGVGSFLGRLGLAAAGTATTGVGGILTQAAGGYAGANVGSGIYDWLFGETTPETALQGSEIPTSSNASLDSSYLNTIAVASNTTNVWLQTLTGFSENIRDDISQIKSNGNIQNNEGLIDLLSSSSQNSEAMISLMAETNTLLQRLIRRYDETANN